MSWDLVKECTVAIISTDGNIFGTGFFISSEGHLLTCAHVVEDAGGHEKIRVNGQPVDLIYLGSRSHDDFAVLQLFDYQGSSVPLSINFQPMDRFLSIGYGRPDFPKGASIDGNITDINPQSVFGNLPMLRLRIKANSQNVQRGYSGSPVFDAENQRVIGIIAAYDNTEGALAVPLSTVQDKWVNLDKFMNLQPFVPPIEANKSARVFISYRSQDPDLSLAQYFYESFKASGHDAFMAGESIQLGEKWTQRIDRELEQCDYFLLLLSPKSATSEMVIEEVRRAKELADLRPEKKPVILPIRVQFPMNSPLNYDLRGHLSQIQQREWKSSADTAKILEEVLNLLAREDSNNHPETDQTEDFSVIPTLQPSNITSTECFALPLPVAEPEIPGGKVDLASKFYVERSPIEERCYENIVKPGSLIRIKAPRQMGKTSLMARILHKASQADCLTVPLTFQLADSKVFQDLDKLLRWFCAVVGRRLKVSNKLKDYWDDIFGSKDNCTVYFEDYLLKEINQPLVLGLDEVDRVFEHSEIAADFFGLLRAWHEQSKSTDIWKKLRLVVVHSTEVYIPMNMHQSPFNVGLPVELREFNCEQILDLARRHGLNWDSIQVNKLTNMVGGHPYLVRVALYRIARQDTTLDQILNIAPTESSLYCDHLRRHLWDLEQHPDIATAMNRVVSNTKAVRLNSIECFKLLSMGLIKVQGNDVTPRCNLYRHYFSDRLRI
ncbi:AAA-like domain-containing protein [Mastigocoleus sp. MO_188.B34]|uniref:AAA-like domain-containing protein n=1 Tax=Mastigocoleus sp. MO_188.B34 TaxID=3036635 RepID=UPI00263985DF|nr:AAA-like domain-containing protein [Mastigocoleus sp. MO_188.B34]MDJ0697662.1 AAA-like domain-containing protein [Mastigocoleus sp. MO_188.B34]